MMTSTARCRLRFSSTQVQQRAKETTSRFKHSAVERRWQSKADLMAHLERRSSSSCSLGLAASRWGRDKRVGDLTVAAKGAKGEEEAGSRGRKKQAIGKREEEAASKQQLSS